MNLLPPALDFLCFFLCFLVALSRPRFVAVFPQKRLPLGAHARSSGQESSQDSPPSTKYVGDPTKFGDLVSCEFTAYV